VQGAIGCRVLLLTVEKLRNGDWPREAIDEMFSCRDLPLSGLINGGQLYGRNQKIDRIVALDEFDMENVLALRETLRHSRHGLTTVRYSATNSAMARKPEKKASWCQNLFMCSPRGTPRVHGARSRPWLLKPRSQASASA